MEKKTGYDAVVFDMDGVIFDSERAVMQCWKELADKYQIPDIEKAVLSCTGTTMKRTREIMLEIYGEDFPYDIYAKESSAIYHSRYDGGRLPMKPGVVELLTFLKEDGKKIALASSTRRQTVTNQLKDAGILNFFDNVICGDMVEHSKPAPDIFLKADKAISTKAIPNMPDSNMMYKYSIKSRITTPPMEEPHTLRSSISRLRILMRVMNRER